MLRKRWVAFQINFVNGVLGMGGVEESAPIEDEDEEQEEEDDEEEEEQERWLDNTA
ncbi:MAG TPA: hypothetical protein VLT36_13180 [Candidatus Dormibacteraeota bacterium]|nr:hypothetical protein [Candidatus Dormibacteraeota bacterium]